MSTALAIASVSMVLKDLLNNGIIDQNINATLNVDVKVTVLSTDRVDTTPLGEKSQLNLFMYMATPNQGWRNEALPSLNARGERISNPYLALDLHYLLSAYSPNELHPEILLGYAMQLLFETPVLPRAAIRRSLSSANVGGDGLPSNLRELSTSGLDDQVEMIKIIPQPLSTEEMSKLWTAFQTRYRPTTAYKATVVLIESTRSFSSPLPVQKRKIVVSPFQNPVIDRILSQATPTAPILANQKIYPGFRLILEGSQLNAGVVQVGISRLAPVTPASGDISNIQITIPLPPGLTAGVNSVQVIQAVLLGEPQVAHNGVSSNAEVFILSPVLQNREVLNPQGTGDDLRPADIHLTVNPAIAPGQEVILLLNESVTNPITTPPLAYTFMALPPPSPPPAPSPDITIPVTGVRKGSYLVRLRIDGAESPLSTDAGGQPNDLLITIP